MNEVIFSAFDNAVFFIYLWAIMYVKNDIAIATLIVAAVSVGLLCISNILWETPRVFYSRPTRVITIVSIA